MRGTVVDDRTLFCLCPNTRKSTFNKKKRNLSCQTYSAGAIPWLLRLDGLVRDTVCDRYAHRAIVRSEEKIGRWGSGPPTKARRVQTRQSRADRRRLFFPLSNTRRSASRQGREKKQAKGRRGSLGQGTQKPLLPTKHAVTSTRCRPRGAGEVGTHSPRASSKPSCSIFFPKPSRLGRSRCRYAGATQRRRPPCWTKRQSACGACGFPRTNTTPVLSASLGPTSRLPRKRTTRRRRESKGPRPLQPRHNYATIDTK